MYCVIDLNYEKRIQEQQLAERMKKHKENVLKGINNRLKEARRENNTYLISELTNEIQKVEQWPEEHKW